MHPPRSAPIVCRGFGVPVGGKGTGALAWLRLDPATVPTMEGRACEGLARANVLLVGVHHRQTRPPSVVSKMDPPYCVPSPPASSTSRCSNQAPSTGRIETRKASRWPCPEHQRRSQGVRQHPTRLRGKVGLHRQQPIRQGFLTHCLVHVVVLLPTIFLPCDFKQKLVVAQAPSEQREFQRLACAETLQASPCREPAHSPSAQHVTPHPVASPLLVDHPHFGRVPVAEPMAPSKASNAKSFATTGTLPKLFNKPSLVGQARPHPVHRPCVKPVLQELGV